MCIFQQKKFCILSCLYAATILLFVLSAISSTKAADILESLEVTGNQRIEVETVRSYLKIREGETFDAKKINQSLKNLFATGLFADVEASRDGKKLIIKVIENPMINRVAFEGNRRIKDETLEVETRLR